MQSVELFGLQHLHPREEFGEGVGVPVAARDAQHLPLHEYGQVLAGFAPLYEGLVAAYLHPAEVHPVSDVGQVLAADAPEERYLGEPFV